MWSAIARGNRLVEGNVKLGIWTAGGCIGLALGLGIAVLQLPAASLQEPSQRFSYLMMGLPIAGALGAGIGWLLDRISGHLVGILSANATILALMGIGVIGLRAHYSYAVALDAGSMQADAMRESDARIELQKQGIDSAEIDRRVLDRFNRRDHVQAPAFYAWPCICLSVGLAGAAFTIHRLGRRPTASDSPAR